MMICTLASNPEQERKKKEKKRKKKSLLYNSDIYWSWSRPTLSVPPVQAKQSKAKQSGEWSWRNDLHRCKKIEIRIQKGEKMNGTSWNLRWTVLGFPSSRHVFFLVFFCTSKMEKLFGGNLATCYSLCVTQIFYNTYCVGFFLSVFFPLDIGPRWGGLH